MELLDFTDLLNFLFKSSEQKSGCSTYSLSGFNLSLALLKGISTLSRILSHKESNPKDAEHFKLGKYFCSQPTHKEMQVLLSMRDDSRRKIVAKKLECSVPTVNN